MERSSLTINTLWVGALLMPALTGLVLGVGVGVWNGLADMLSVGHPIGFRSLSTGDIVAALLAASLMFGGPVGLMLAVLVLVVRILRGPLRIAHLLAIGSTGAFLLMNGLVLLQIFSSDITDAAGFLFEWALFVPAPTVSVALATALVLATRRLLGLAGLTEPQAFDRPRG